MSALIPMSAPPSARALQKPRTPALVLTLTFLCLAPSALLPQSAAEAPPVKAALRIADEWLEYQVARQNLPSLSIGLVIGGDLLFKKSYGYADVESRTPATADTIYSICSVSKVFTAAAALQLRDANELSLDQEISELIPWYRKRDTFPAGGPVTVHGLLSHSSGLPDDLKGTYWSDQRFPSRDEVEELLNEATALFPASTREEYSNVGYEMAGFVVEETAGRSFADYIRSEFLEPLGMDDTTLDIPVGDPKLATGYSGGGRSNQRDEIAPYQIKSLTAAAGMASTVNDLLKFVTWQFRVLASGETEILSPSTLREMMTVQWFNPGQTAHRGYGYSVVDLGGQTIAGKDGGCPGYVSLVILDPQTQLGGVLLINANGADPWAFLRGASELLGPALGRAAAMAQASMGEAPTDLSRFEGVYRGYPSDMEVVLVADGGTLVQASLNTLSPAGGLVKLRPVGDLRFERLGSNGETVAEVVFVPDGDGAIAELHTLGSAWTKTR